MKHPSRFSLKKKTGLTGGLFEIFKFSNLQEDEEISVLLLSINYWDISKKIQAVWVSLEIQTNYHHLQKNLLQ